MSGGSAGDRKEGGVSLWWTPLLHLFFPTGHLVATVSLRSGPGNRGGPSSLPLSSSRRIRGGPPVGSPEPACGGKQKPPEWPQPRNEKKKNDCRWLRPGCFKHTGDKGAPGRGGGEGKNPLPEFFSSPATLATIVGESGNLLSIYDCLTVGPLGRERRGGRESRTEEREKGLGSQAPARAPGTTGPGRATDRWVAPEGLCCLGDRGCCRRCVLRPTSRRTRGRPTTR